MNGIKIMRERAGITQKKLADEMGIVQSTVAMWESGEIDISRPVWYNM